MRFLQIVLIMMIAMSCNKRANESSKTINTNDSVEELFEDFFIKFSTDSVYQNSRIKFPLLSIVEGDSGESEQNFIQQKDWGFADLTKLKEPKYIKTIEKVNMKEQHLILQIKDTGVHVIYVFKREENKWLLTQITDNGD